MLHETLAKMEKEGFLLLSSAIQGKELKELTKEVERLRASPNALDRGKGGYALRHILQRSECIREFASSPTLSHIAETLLGKGAKPVKGILFDKGQAANWSVRWHQDVTISVKERIDTSGYDAWSIKDGVPHVRPPVNVIQDIVAFRIHLDDCGEDNGPLKVLPGCHRHGYLTREGVLQLARDTPSFSCVAGIGDVLMMKPLLVHSSSRATSPDHRRVLHIEYSSRDLHYGLEWFESDSTLIR